jgi:hypothetical protein
VVSDDARGYVQIRLRLAFPIGTVTLQLKRRKRNDAADAAGGGVLLVSAGSGGQAPP